ncbi:hypothetical protein DCAR_0417934 [Daucus carota subsp. sativus]|uniref:Uncharacterized protein n=1 Tax=Daucus carota subsp. sativus TaxID=79200 RepID=A0A165Z136_DAUCS|nr:hypothetical protein DCAR_0417934 [Daucus carota subsp. sativus]
MANSSNLPRRIIKETQRLLSEPGTVECISYYPAKEVPDDICNDKYCTLHSRDNYQPNMNYGAGYPPLFRGGLNYNYPPMSSFVPPPPPLPPYGQ